MIPRWLNRGWRIAGTGCSFAVFGIGGLVLTVTVVPALHLFVRSPLARKRRAQRVISAACRCFVGFMRLIGVLDYRVTGREHLRHPGALIVANHPSLIDAVFLIALTPEVDCVINQDLWHNPFTGGPVRLAGYISNGTGPALVDRCCESLQAGHRLIIFPEGTRTRPGQRLYFQRGAANIAVHAGADLVPVTIIFKQTTLTKGEPWYHVPTNKVELSISVEPPIAVSPYLENTASQPLAARKLTADLYDYYTAKLARAGRLPENDPWPG
ncbi:MAG: 1-acyl-sn-glycerol-3-phosphate acyltransferase [Salinisphaera sp.]|nr:1-acyl-sn-glycerol-3-phosphate acyltransferase [Nevskiaceae bacterium]MDN5937566.1 1-acyl-sn-glycerol-3-phosphate acyltransferase [Salinisphaera sp.]